MVRTDGKKMIIAWCTSSSSLVVFFTGMISLVVRLSASEQLHMLMLPSLQTKGTVTSHHLGLVCVPTPSYSSQHTHL